MPALVDNITALVEAIITKFNVMTPRLPPLGGAANTVLGKSTSTDNAYQWMAVHTPTSLTFAGGLKRTGAALSTTAASAFSVTGVPTAGQVLASFYLPYAINIDVNMCGGIATIAPTTAYQIFLKRAGVTVVTWTWGIGSLIPVVSVQVAAPAAGNYTLEGQATADTTITSPSPTLGYSR